MELKAVNVTIPVIGGTKNVWIISDGSPVPTARVIASSLGISEKTYRQVCLLNGGMEFNKTICFESEERANAAIASLKKKAEMTPIRTALINGENQISVTYTVDAETFKECLRDYCDDDELYEVILAAIEDGDFDDLTLVDNILSYFNDNLGVDAQEWDSFTVNVVEADEVYVITISGTV